MSPKQVLFPESMDSQEVQDQPSVVPIYGTMFSSDRTGQDRLPHKRTYSAIIAPTQATGRSRSRSMPTGGAYTLAEGFGEAHMRRSQSRQRSGKPASLMIGPGSAGRFYPLSEDSDSSLQSSAGSGFRAQATQDSESATTPEPSDNDSEPEAKPTARSTARPTTRYREPSTAASSPALREWTPSAMERLGLSPAFDHRYGTPEMRRGLANLPYIPAPSLRPQVSKGHVKHLPRAEKLPLTGYELVAAKLAASSGRDSPRSTAEAATKAGEDEDAAAQTPIAPMYRKFEALNHRVLLHLQDELSELEEQLHRLDSADTQNRRLQHGILPASRRAESQAGGELQGNKARVLGKIGHKLGQYNNALASFSKTQRLASPRCVDVESYRAYLDAQQPIAEAETRFLDAADDLVSLAAASPGLVQAIAEDEPAAVAVDTVVTQMPMPGFLQIAVALLLTVLVPALMFAVVPEFLGCLAVLLLAGLTLHGIQMQAQQADEMGGRDLLLCAGMCGAMMAAVAGAMA